MVLKTLLKQLIRLGDVLISPIANNCAFFLNVLLLLIIPTIINAFFINYVEYISFSPDYPWGILIKYGASFPYILFIPFLVSYILSLIACLCSNKKVKIIWKIVIYIILGVLFAVNVFLLINFKTMLSPSIILLLHETDTTESFDFIHNYFWDIHSLYTYLLIILIITLFYAKSHDIFMPWLLKTLIKGKSKIGGYTK